VQEEERKDIFLTNCPLATTSKQKYLLTLRALVGVSIDLSGYVQEEERTNIFLSNWPLATTSKQKYFFYTT
jgi:hypothetical protein